jgi:cytochrome c biogenesis protein CcdA
MMPAVWEAFAWGIWTSLNPCPMATNIAAVSFLGRRVASPWRVLSGGLLYATGRAATYVALTLALVGGVRATGLSEFLETRMLQLLGPVMVVVAMFLLELLHFNLPGGAGEVVRRRVEAWGTAGAFLLGVLFALSFCPVSAGIFFLYLFRLATTHGSSVALPAAYGLGTALPVVVFAVLIATSARALGRTFNALAQVERWLRRAAGAVFLAVGIYFSLRYCFGLF